MKNEITLDTVNLFEVERRARALRAEAAADSARALSRWIRALFARAPRPRHAEPRHA